MNTMAEDNSYMTIDPNAQLGQGAISLPFEFKNIDNWRPQYRGGMSKTFGFSEYKDTGTSSPITGLYRFKTSAGTSLLMVGQGTDVYKLVSGTLTSISMTVSSGAYLDFTTAYDYLVVCDGASDAQTFDGASTVADLSADTQIAGARQTLFYKDRLWLFSATHDQSLLYYSDAGDITAGYATNFVNCDNDDGQKITAISEFFIPGELEPVIIVAKEKSIGVVTGDGTATNPFTFSKISNDLGVYGFRQIVQWEQDAAFLTQRGISSYRSTLANQNIQQTLLSRNITNQFTGLSQTYLPNALCWLDWKNRRFTFAVPTAGSEYPNTLWHYDTDLNGFYKQTGFNVTSAFVDDDGYVYTGNSTGVIYKHDSTVNTYDGAIINATLQTPYMDFFEPQRYKRIKNGRIAVRGSGTYNLGVSTKINYGVRAGSSHNIALVPGQYVWGGGVWTDDPGTYQWGANPLNRKKFFPSGIFENISFIFTQNGASQPADLVEMVFEVEYLDLI